jgi:hypothetical protein
VAVVKQLVGIRAVLEDILSSTDAEVEQWEWVIEEKRKGRAALLGVLRMRVVDLVLSPVSRYRTPPPGRVRPVESKK